MNRRFAVLSSSAMLATILSASAAFAETTAYNCTPKYHDAGTKPFTVEVTLTKAYVSIDGASECGLKLDPKYRPIKYKNYDRFLAGSCKNTGDSIRLPKDFVDGVSGGIAFMDIPGRGEGTDGEEAITYNCTRQ
jgi:hypothetical protein